MKDLKKKFAVDDSKLESTPRSTPAVSPGYTSAQLKQKQRCLKFNEI